MYTAGHCSPVQVVRFTSRHVDVDHQTCPWHIDASRGHASAHQNGGHAVSEAGGCFIPKHLRQVAMQQADW